MNIGRSEYNKLIKIKLKYRKLKALIKKLLEDNQEQTKQEIKQLLENNNE